jgi:hypothetical protein
MCTGLTLGGQLGATATRNTSPRRAWVIGFHRTDTGYFMNLRRDNTVTLRLTDGPRLAHDWHELTGSLPPLTRVP